MATRVSSRMMTNVEATQRTTAAVVRPVGWWALGVARILVGYLWYQQILWKLPPNFSGNNGLRQWMLREVAHPLVPLYGAFVRDVALTHYHLFGWITFLTETAIALSLIFGLFGRLGALAGTLWAINLAVGLWNVPGEWYWTYLMLVLLNGIFLATAAGRYIGLDALVRGRVLPGLHGGLARVVGLIS